MCEIIVDCPHFTPEWTDRGYIVIRNQNIRNGSLDLSDPSYTHRADFERRIKRAKPKAEDIIFTREAPMGEVCMIPENLECCIGQRQVLLRPKKDIDGRYLFFALRSEYVRHQIFWNEGTGSTVSNVRIPVLEALKIPRLGAFEKAIAAILGALDDKIELNRQMNVTLEAMARLFFKDWFVDFGPTRAKAESRPPYLAPELWALFPDALDDDDKPVGWKPVRLGDIAEGVTRTVNPSEVVSETPYIGLEHMPRRSIALDSWEGAGKVRSGKLHFKSGELLFGKLRPYFHKVGVAPVNGICSTDIVVCVAKRKTAYGFILSLISSDEFVAYTDQTSTGTKMPRTSWPLMARYEITLPSEPILEAFNNLLLPWIELIRANIHESLDLAQTRDLLLPKLISGEIRLSEAEKIV
jgi:type I restriction enzyme S subunit